MHGFDDASGVKNVNPIVAMFRRNVSEQMAYLMLHCRSQSSACCLHGLATAAIVINELILLPIISLEDTETFGRSLRRHLTSCAPQKVRPNLPHS